MKHSNLFDLAAIISQLGTLSGAPNALANSGNVFQNLSQRQQDFESKASAEQKLQDLIGTAAVPGVPFDINNSPLMPVEPVPGTGFAGQAGLESQQVEMLKNLASVSPDSVLKGLSGQIFPDAKQQLLTQPRVQSSQQMSGGLVQLVMTDGTIKTVAANEADSAMIREAEQRGAELQGVRAGFRGEAKTSTGLALKAYQGIVSGRKQIRDLNEGINLLKNGARTGAVQSLLPSVRAESIKLDNLQKRLGLNVVSNTTFGALSQGELDLALSSALPKNLNEIELTKWMEEKRNAQSKLIDYYQKSAEFLGTPGNTMAQFLKMQKNSQQQTPQQFLENLAQPQTIIPPLPPGFRIKQ